MSYPTFPLLSRKPALKTAEQWIDPTLRDPLENGMEGTMVAWTRRRRTFSVSIDLLTEGDKAKLDEFTRYVAVYGGKPFLFIDTRDQYFGQILTVRFADKGLPTFMDAGWVLGEYRQNCTFIIGEM